METGKNPIFSELSLIIRQLRDSFVPENRIRVLQPLISYIREKAEVGEEARINFICTHNSRRSLLSQVWAETLANFFGIAGVTCYSGGTEVTAVYPAIIETLKKSGFRVVKLSASENPVYAIKHGPNMLPVVAFSKTFDHPFNPQSDFAAVLTCSQADEGCPYISGASRRIPVTYEDPKSFDGTAQQSEKYRERSLQIAAELFYVFSQIKSHSNGNS